MRSSTASKYTSLGITAACFWAIYGILGCGDSSTTQTPPNDPLLIQELRIDFRDYAPFRQSVNRTFNQGTYSTVVISPSDIGVTWRGSVPKDDDTTEEFRIRGDWVQLDAYLSGKYRWESIATRSEINYGQGWVDVTPKDGYSLYGPVIVPKDGFTLRQWGCIRNDTRYQPAGCEKRWFHQHRITYAGRVYNDCWKGLGDSTREALKQEEVWWDSDGGWVRGTGTMKDGLPTGEVTMGFYQTIAKDAGYVWTGSGVCLIQ